MARKCKDCKNSRGWGHTNSQYTYDNYNCNIKNETVKGDGKCWRFIKRYGKIHNIQGHWLKHWKFWVNTILIILGLILGYIAIK